MSTTTLVAELLVIGVGAAVWVCLLLLAAFGYDWVPLERLFSTTATVPLLAVVYLLGIVTDRFADAVLGPLWAKQNRARAYGPDARSYAADKALVLSDPQFCKLFDYNKSRQRICRGWAFNSLAILISLHAFLWLQFDPDPVVVRVALLGSLLLLVQAGGCWVAARQLNAVQYHKVREQAAIVRARSGATTPGASTGLGEAPSHS